MQRKSIHHFAEQHPVVFLRTLALSDVLFYRDELADLTIVTQHRSDGGILDADAPILALIHHLTLPHLASQNGGPEFFVKVRIMPAGFQKPHVQAPHILHRIAG